MSDWAVGLSTGCFFRTNIFDCLQEIRNAGFDLIEICSFPAHLDYHDQQKVQAAATRMASLGLEAHSFHAPFADEIDITAVDPQWRNRSRDELLRAADAAIMLDVRYFVIHPGPEKGGLPEQERLERMHNAVNVLDEVSQHCQQHGVALVLENMLPHLFSGHIRELLWILGALLSTDIGICLDTGHAHLSGDLRTVVHKLSGHLWMIHASDNRGSFDDHLPPGDGEIAWKALLQQLSDLRFCGSIILEIAGNTDAETRTILAGANRARRHLRGISREISLR
jgi:sugar phosphate isomerase/epimerase